LFECATERPELLFNAIPLALLYFADDSVCFGKTIETCLV